MFLYSGPEALHAEHRAVHASEAHGIDASLMRAAEGLARRTVGLGHGAEGFTRVGEVLSRRRAGPGRPAAGR
ncbi:hypothetical protein EAO70_12170 [Streptomyces sp. adm13(2018)]|nr:hypothetical protein [Streptomyces sp. adm13(2018)]TXS19505.1 hypothetical protein EAO70_12170 [Streptomyces sp. adm13(2018)]